MKKLLLLVGLVVFLTPTFASAEIIACEVIGPNEILSEQFVVQKDQLQFYKIDDKKKIISLYKVMYSNNLGKETIIQYQDPKFFNLPLDNKSYSRNPRELKIIHFGDNEIIFMHDTRQKLLEAMKNLEIKNERLENERLKDEEGDNYAIAIFPVIPYDIHFIYELDRLTGILIQTGTRIDENGESLDIIIREKMLCYGKNFVKF